MEEQTYKPIEAKLPFWGTYFLFPLVWLFSLYLLFRLLDEEYYTIVHLADDKGTGAYWLPVFWQFGAFALQLSYRGIFWKKLNPNRHIFDSWILITTALVSLILSGLIFAHGHWQGVFLLAYGVWMFQYAWHRPRYRSGSLLVLKLPMSSPNLWFQIWLSKYGHFTVACVWALTWAIPWNLLAGFEWYLYLVNYLQSVAPALEVLAEKAANPEYAVGMNVAYLFMLPITAVVGFTQIQLGDNVANGILKGRYAKRYYVVCLIGFLSSFLLVSDYLSGEFYTKEIIRNNDVLLALFFSVELWVMNVSLLIVGSITLGWYLGREGKD